MPDKSDASRVGKVLPVQPKAKARTVIGFDLGTQCGFAVMIDGKVSASGTLDLKPRRHSSPGMRFVHARREFATLMSSHHDVIVFYEEVRRHAGTDAAHVYGGLLACVQEVCENLHIDYQGIPVGTVKKRATGKGNAKKDAMIREAIQMFPTQQVKDDNQADALWVAQCGYEMIK